MIKKESILHLLLLRVIATIEIIGGVSGSVIMFYRMTSVLDNLKFAIFLLGYLLPFILSIIAGILLLKKRVTGLNLSLLIQLIQIPYFALNGLYYSFISGLLLGIRISFQEGMNNYNFNFMVGGYCQIQTGLPVEILAFGINIFAVATFSFLFFIKLTRREFTSEKVE